MASLGILAAAADEPLLVRVSTRSKGMMPSYERIYEVNSEGRLSIRHQASGGNLLEERRVQLDSTELSQCRELLARDGLSGPPPDAARIAIRSRAKSSDGFVWLVEVFGPSKPAEGVVIPPKYESRWSPELAAVPYLQTAWELIALLEGKWDKAAAVER
jgi:hypothetical protein